MSVRDIALRWGSRLFHAAGPLRRIVFRPARALYLLAARNREVVVWCGDGYLAVRSGDPVAKWLLSGGFEGDERRFVRRMLRSGDLFVDGGAHVGAYTVLAARRVGPKGVVVAFEPDPENRRRLERSVAANRLGNVVVSDVALSDRDGEAAFTRDSANTGGHSLVASTIDRPGSAIAVPTETLDGFLARRFPHAADRRVVLKLDLQGHEARAIAGARDTLRRTAAFVIELTPLFLELAGDDPAAFVHALLHSGFRIETIPQSPGAPRMPVGGSPAVETLVAALRASSGHVDLLGERSEPAAAVS